MEILQPDVFFRQFFDKKPAKIFDTRKFIEYSKIDNS